MSNRDRRRMTIRRLLAYALVPLSTIPFLVTAPLVAPSVEKRVEHMRGQPTEPAGAAAGPHPERRVVKPARRPRGE